MQIKNYIVDNIEVVIDYLERLLCQKGISYVRIENEFHFNNQIVRLYDLEIHKEIIFAWSLSKFEEEKLIDVNSFFDDTVNLSRNLVETYTPVMDLRYLLKEEKTYQPRKKSTYKQESKRVNQLLKKYKR